MKLMKTAIYVRVSTEEQAQEGFSIRGQTEKLKNYALLKEWDIYDIYADEGLSGKNTVDRPAINRLIDDIKGNKINNVLVFKVDRLTRSIKNLMELVEIFDKYNCAFNSLTESIDTDTPSGRMFLKIIGIFAEFERENLITRVTLGLERKVKEGYGLSAFGKTSYGYDRPKGEKVQTVNIIEAKIVEEIFNLYLKENKSMLQIAKILNDRKIPTKKNTGKWIASTIRVILNNPNYIGKVRYSMENEERYFEADGLHEKIIDDETFKFVQEKLSKNQKIFKTKRPREESYFCGVLYCGECGNKFTTHNAYGKNKDGSKWFCNSYQCSGKMYDGCKTPNIVHKKVEKIFDSYVENINLFELENANFKSDETEAKQRKIYDYIIECEKKLEIHEKKKKQINIQYMNDEIRFDDYRQLLEVANEKYQMLLNEIEKAQTEIPKVKSITLTKDDIILSLQENWQTLNKKERFTFLQRFVKKIVLVSEKQGKNSRSIFGIKLLEFDL